MTAPSRRPDYGIDAPGLVRMFFVAGAVALLVCAAAAWLLAGWRPWGLVVVAVAAVVTTYCLGMGSYMIYGSKVAKPRDRETLLDLLTWRGDEMVLDVGCGRGRWSARRGG